MQGSPSTHGKCTGPQHVPDQGLHPLAPYVLGLTAGGPTSGTTNVTRPGTWSHPGTRRHPARWSHGISSTGQSRPLPGQLVASAPSSSRSLQPTPPSLFPPGCDLNLHFLLCLRIVSALHTLSSGTAGTTRGLTASDSPAPAQKVLGS